MRKSNYLFPALAIGLTAVSCQDYDAGVTADTFKKKEYAENFKNVFGNIDPNQNWSMAAQFVAEANLGDDVNGTLLIYTKAPTVKGSELLATVPIESGKATVKFDAVKNTVSLHARVVNNGEVITSGTYNVVDGVLYIGQNLGTRADGTPAAPEDAVTRTAYTASVRHMNAEVIKKFIESKEESYTDYNNREDDTYKIKVTPEHGDPYYIVAKNMGENDNNCSTYENVPKLYALNNVDFSHHDDGFTADELKPIFGNYVNADGITKEGVFKEGVNHIEQYVKTGDMTTDVTLEVNLDGPVEIDLMWRGTQYNDIFGYYYYTDEDLKTVDWWNNVEKYILIDNRDASTNWIGGTTSLTQKKNWDSTEEATATWNDVDGMFSSNFVSWTSKNMVRGTKIKLVNFSSGSASYNFTAGTKIGFFFADKQNLGWKFFLSDTKIDYELFMHQYSPTNAPAGTKTGDVGRGGRPYAAKFVYDGRTYVGFGDQSGDCDLNDIVLIAKNVVPPSKDITPGDLPEPEAASWLLACEDLGNTGDFDFNDVVFKVSHVANETKAKITALAAGGTLPIELTYNGTTLEGPNGGTQFNSWFDDGRIETGVVINAGTGTRSATGKSITISVPADFSVANTVDGNKMGGFAVNVYNREEGTYTTVTAPENGEAPQMMCLPSTWVWPNENARIDAAYPAFGEWGENYNETNWYMHYNVDNLVATPSYESINLEEVGKVEDGGADPNALTAGTYNLNIPDATTFSPSFGGTYQSYKLNIGKTSCSDDLTATVTITLKSCPVNQLEIVTKDGTFLGRMGFYNGDLTASLDLTNADLKKLIAGEFNVINYASSDVEMASFTLVVE